jgi:hypothetical protein
MVYTFRWKVLYKSCFDDDDDDDDDDDNDDDDDFVLKIESARLSKTLVSYHFTTWRHNQKITTRI